MSSSGLLAHFIRRDRKKQGITKIPLWVNMLGLVLIFAIPVVLIYKIVNQPIHNKPQVISPSTPQPSVPPLENAELYVDTAKAISFLYPKGTHKVRVDSEAEYSRLSGAGIPNSFTNLKKYTPPKVAWALKVEEMQTETSLSHEDFIFEPFSVWVFENQENMDVLSWFDKYWYYPFMWGDASDSTIEEMKPKSVLTQDGLQTYVYNYGPSQMGYVKYVYISHGNKMYLFNLAGDEEISLEDQIFASFKFLEP